MADNLMRRLAGHRELTLSSFVAVGIGAVVWATAAPAAATARPRNCVVGSNGAPRSVLATRWPTRDGAQLPLATLKPGDKVPRGATGLAPNGTYLGTQIFVGAARGYALVGVGNAAYPAVTNDSGRIWRIDGAAVSSATTGAAAPLGVIGAAGPNSVFIWSGLMPGKVVQTTTDGGKRWWRATFPGLTTYVGDQAGYISGRFTVQVIADVWGKQRSSRSAVPDTVVWQYREAAHGAWRFVGCLNRG